MSIERFSRNNLKNLNSLINDMLLRTHTLYRDVISDFDASVNIYKLNISRIAKELNSDEKEILYSATRSALASLSYHSIGIVPNNFNSVALLFHTKYKGKKVIATTADLDIIFIQLVDSVQPGRIREAIAKKVFNSITETIVPRDAVKNLGLVINSLKKDILAVDPKTIDKEAYVKCITNIVSRFNSTQSYFLSKYFKFSMSKADINILGQSIDNYLGAPKSANLVYSNVVKKWLYSRFKLKNSEKALTYIQKLINREKAVLPADNSLDVSTALTKHNYIGNLIKGSQLNELNNSLTDIRNIAARLNIQPPKISGQTGYSTEHKKKIIVDTLEGEYDKVLDTLISKTSKALKRTNSSRSLDEFLSPILSNVSKFKKNLQAEADVLLNQLTSDNEIKSFKDKVILRISSLFKSGIDKIFKDRAVKREEIRRLRLDIVKLNKLSTKKPKVSKSAVKLSSRNVKVAKPSIYSYTCTEALNLSKILHLNLEPYVRKRMAKSTVNTHPSYLRWISGEFGKSVAITSYTATQDTLTARYTYTKRPYAIAWWQGMTKGRDTNLIASGAITEALTDFTKNRFKIQTKGGY